MFKVVLTSYLVSNLCFQGIWFKSFHLSHVFIAKLLYCKSLPFTLNCNYLFCSKKFLKLDKLNWFYNIFFSRLRVRKIFSFPDKWHGSYIRKMFYFDIWNLQKYFHIFLILMKYWFYHSRSKRFLWFSNNTLFI